MSNFLSQGNPSSEHNWGHHFYFFLISDDMHVSTAMFYQNCFKKRNCLCTGILFLFVSVLLLGHLARGKLENFQWTLNLLSIRNIPKQQTSKWSFGLLQLGSTQRPLPHCPILHGAPPVSMQDKWSVYLNAGPAPVLFGKEATIWCNGC